VVKDHEENRDAPKDLDVQPRRRATLHEDLCA
jgi:hypothetical protein